MEGANVLRPMLVWGNSNRSVQTNKLSITVYPFPIMMTGVWGTIISALIGGISGIAVVLLREKLNQDRKISKTRRALYAEIDSAEIEVAKNLIEGGYSQPFYRQVDFLPTDVYDQNVGEIGLLDESEIDAVIEYYSLAKTVRSETSALHTVAEDDDYEYQVGQSAIGSLKNDLSTLIDRQEKALAELRTELNVEDTFNDED